ncbi:MAG: glycosyltransferase [bacterium]
MNIAILGTRGIPANYGGFETFAENLSFHLVRRGHSVTVYGRSTYVNKDRTLYNGVRLKVLPTISHKYLDTPVNTLLASLHAVFLKYDIVLICNSANSFCSFFPRLSGKPVVLNVDGLEWKRAKWSIFGRWVYRISEWLATFIPTHIVTDARDVQKYYEKKFNKESTYIPYGSTVTEVKSATILDKYKLKKREYFLYVSRLEPENNAHVVIKAYKRVNTNYPLVIVGDAPYSKNYIQSLKKMKDERVIFTGYVFDKGYSEFQSHAYCYLQATEVGGTHPALVEAMGHGNCIIANDVPEHREVLADTGMYFNAKDIYTLVKRMDYVLAHPQDVAEYRRKAQERVQKMFTWEKVTSDYENLFRRMVRGKQS